MVNIEIEEKIKCFDCENFVKVVCKDGKRLIECKKYGLKKPDKIRYVYCKKEDCKKDVNDCRLCGFFDGIKDNDLNCRYIDYLINEEKKLLNETVDELTFDIKHKYKNVYKELQKIKYEYCCNVTITDFSYYKEYKTKSVYDMKLERYINKKIFFGVDCRFEINDDNNFVYPTLTDELMVEFDEITDKYGSEIIIFVFNKIIGDNKW
jgi:hypothetical protein